MIKEILLVSFEKVFWWIPFMSTCCILSRLHFLIHFVVSMKNIHHYRERFDIVVETVQTSIER